LREERRLKIEGDEFLRLLLGGMRRGHLAKLRKGKSPRAEAASSLEAGVCPVNNMKEAGCTDQQFLGL